MKQSETIQRACRVLRRKVRFKDASLHLDPDKPFQDDTALVREATRVYVESWIEPILAMIENGNTRALADFIKWDRSDSLEGMEK